MDVAALSMSVDTTDVVKAANDLDRFSASSDKAAAASSKFSRNGSIAKMAQDYDRAARAAEQASSASSRAAAVAVSANNSVASSSTRVGRAMADANAHVAAYRAQLASLPAATNQAAAGIARVTKAANDNARNMQATPGNIAAQFQDIGVTAAMDMNPLLIALQQGTQLSSAFAGGGLASLSSAFKEILSPVSLLTIGMVALVAALIQMVDWSTLAKSVLNGLADILEAIAPYALGAAAALALIYSPAIIAGVVALTKGFLGLAASMLACIPIPVLIVAGLTAIVAAANHWRDDLTRIFGVDIVAAAKSGVNFIVGSFVGGYNAIVETWSMLPGAVGDFAYATANRVIDATNGMINAVKSQLNELIVLRNTETGERSSLFNFDTRGSTFGRINNPNAGMLGQVFGIAQRAMNSARGQDYVGRGVDMARGWGRSGANALRGWASGIGASDKANSGAGSAGRAAELSEEARALQERNRATEQYILNLTEEVAKIGLSDEALRKYEVTQALSKATTDAQREAIEKLSAQREVAITKLRQQQELEAAQKALDAKRADITGGIDIELQTMGLVGAEREREVLRIQRQIEMTDLLAKIKKAEADGNVALADTYRQLAEAVDEKYAKQVQLIDGKEGIDRFNRGIDEARSATKSFFSDWRQGVRDGEGFFKAFSNSVINSLNRMIDRMMDGAIDAFFDKFRQGGGGGGFFGSILNAIGLSSKSGIQNASLNLIANNPSIFANGGAFDRAQYFANGGSFSNSILNSPTLFAFANGGKLGVAGEAGPEAVMPLTRGPNGKLGVQSHGGNSGRPTVIFSPTINNNNSFAGAIGIDSIAAMQLQSGQMTKDEIRRELQTMLEQLERDGTIV